MAPMGQGSNQGDPMMRFGLLFWIGVIILAIVALATNNAWLTFVIITLGAIAQVGMIAALRASDRP